MLMSPLGPRCSRMTTVDTRAGSTAARPSQGGQGTRTGEYVSDQVDINGVGKLPGDDEAGDVSPLEPRPPTALRQRVPERSTTWASYDTEVQLRIMHHRMVSKRLRYKHLALGKRGGTSEWLTKHPRDLESP